MLRFTGVLLCLIISGLNGPAVGQVFSTEEQALIEEFPSSTDALDWAELHSRVVAEDTTARETFVAAIVALRTGAKEPAKSYSQRVSALAQSADDRTRARFLETFIAFYLGPEAERESASHVLLSSLSDYNQSALQIDWLMGTAATLLLDYSLNHGDPELSRNVIAEMHQALDGRKDMTSGIWLVNSNLKAAYTASQYVSEDVDPFAFLFDATQIIGDFAPAANDEDSFQTLQMLYLRMHTTFGVIYSRRKIKDLSVPIEVLPFVPEFHPSFQTECVSDITKSKTRFRPRRKYGTGSMMVRLEVDNRGRVRFGETIDAQPSRLKDKFMHSYLRKWANSMRVIVFADKPECQTGGELLLPFTLYWD